MDDDNVTRTAVLAAWSLTMMRRAFRDLAVSFASIDAGTALDAIAAIERNVAAELTAVREKGAKGIAIPDDALAALARDFREMSQGALREIEQLQKPV